ncbi:MAG: PAS domain S-box protein [Methanobacteriaceae archaeon]|nr:PAS domain S-box protein [Methanobacteriaceae archaeon]
MICIKGGVRTSDNFQFIELIDGDRIKTFMESFYKLTKIPSTLIDLEGNILKNSEGEWIAAGWQDICLNFHRKNPKTLKNCILSDTTCSKNLSNGKEYTLYRCLNGLIDVAVPLYIEDKHVANLFTGQFFFEKPDLEFFRKQANKYGFNEEDYLKSLSKVPIFKEEYIFEGINFLKNLAVFISEIGLKQKRLQIKNQELMESENKFKTFTDGMISGLVITHQGYVKYANLSMEKLLKIPENKSLKGRNIIDFMTPTSQDIAIMEISKRQEKAADAKDTIELELIRCDGKKIICEVHASSIEIKGKIYGLSNFQDITERKNTEELLEYSERKYHTLFDNAAEGILLLRQDIIIECNEAAARIFGANIDDFLGKKPYEMSPKTQEDGLESKTKGIKYINAALDGEPQSFEWIHKKMDGSTIFTNISLNRLEIEGEYILLAIIRDITSRKIAEKKLKELTENLKIRFNVIKTINELSELLSYTELPSSQVFHKIVRTIPEGLKHPQNATVRVKIYDNIFESDNFQKTSLELKSPIRLNSESIGYLKIFYNEKIPFKGEEPFIREERYLINNLALKIGDFIENRKIKEELINERDNLKRILDNMEDGVYICSPNYDVEYVNPILEKEFGSFEDKKCYQYLHNRDEECPWCVNDRVFQGETVKWEWHSKKTGQTYDILDTHLINPDGTVSKLEFLHEITVQKNIQEELNQQKDFLETILDNAPIMIAHINKKGYPIYVNKMWEEKLGWPLKDTSQRDIFKELYPDPEYREYVIDYINRSEGTWSDFKTRTRDGRILDTSWANIKLDDGTNIGMGQDITERKKMERIIQKSELKYRLLFETMSQGVVYQDYNGNIISANPAAQEILGLTLDQMMGRSSLDPRWKSIHEDGTEFPGETHPSMVALKTGKNVKNVIMGVFNPDQNCYRWININAMPQFRDGETKPYQVYTTFEDVTESKNAEKKIKKSLKEKEVLLREIHHRVKNNMQIISSLLNLQLLQIDDQNIMRFFMDTQARVKAMAMIHEKLYESKDLSYIPFSDYVKRLLSQLFDSYAQDPSRIKLVLDIEEIYYNIETAIPLSLILNELVLNVLKHAFPGVMQGQLTIKLEKMDGINILTVADDGVGISEEIDFRNTTTLGLELVNSLVNQIDGEIELDRSHGTKFTIKYNEVEYKKGIINNKL